nr:ketopantoate reductase C-terminal domain-containing protein [uncultured Psychroserpens sp.]
MKTKTTIGILGVGAIGTVIAYHLQQLTLHELFYFSRTKKDSLNLIIDHATIKIPVGIQTKTITPKTLDWLIICLKEHQYQQAQHWFSELISAETKIVVIRNGLNLKTPMLVYVSEDQILECMIDCPTQLLKNGYYQSQLNPQLTVPKSDLAFHFESLLSTSNILINQVADFKTESWKKLCESAALGAILCLHNDTCRIFKDLSIRNDYSNLLNESIQVAKADGAKIEEDFTEKMLFKLMQYPETKGSSMLTDFQNGKPTELGAKNGIISQLGKQYGVHTPINNKVIKLLS